MSKRNDILDMKDIFYLLFQFQMKLTSALATPVTMEGHAVTMALIITIARAHQATQAHIVKVGCNKFKRRVQKDL